MNEKENSNKFRFSLYQGDILLCEKIFDADLFNPFTRYSIDIRDILPKSITALQKVLSKKNYDIILEVGRKDINDAESEHYYYDSYHAYQDIINSFPQQYRNEFKYNPQPIVQQIDDKVIKGVECKIGLYINDKPIVERLFYVDGFNPVSRWSNDVVYTVVDIADKIFDNIKKNDIRNMWDDYDLIDVRGLSINEIRLLTPQKRDELLNRIKRN